MEIGTAAPSLFDPAISGKIGAMDNAPEVEREAGDTLNVSREALLLTEALRAANNAPDMRPGRVAELRAKIANGEYNINARDIALALVAEDPGIFSQS